MIVGLGILSGVLGFLPFYFSLKLLRRSATIAPISIGIYGLGGALISLFILMGALIACAVLARDSILPFALFEIVVFLGCTIVYVIYKNMLAKRKSWKKGNVG